MKIHGIYVAIDCPTCNGKGRIAATDHSTRRDCPKCAGGGRVMSIVSIAELRELIRKDGDA